MAGCGCGSEDATSLERRALLMLLGIYAAIFVSEAIVGWLVESAGLLADALVYGIAFMP